jgi:hypothetical protein
VAPTRVEPEDTGQVGRIVPTSGSWARERWHAEGALRFPGWSAFKRGLPHLIREHVAPGHAPAAGILSSDDSVITVGSCFARELRSYLQELGFESKSFWVPAGLNNSFAILDFVSWCVTGRETGRGFRYDETDDREIREWKPEHEREAYLQGLRDAGAFVFTLGLAEVWQDRETGEVFWRGVPRSIFDAERHEFRLSTVEENEENLTQVIELIRSVNPNAPIVLTLSPVPLAATFRGISCVTADCVSKSVLRVALDRVMAQGLESVYYWPSFEVVRWLGSHLPWRFYGTEDHHTRVVPRYVVAEIIDAFVDAFYTPAAVAELRAARGRTVHAPWSMHGRLGRVLNRRGLTLRNVRGSMSSHSINRGLKHVSKDTRLAAHRVRRRAAGAALRVVRLGSSRLAGRG